MTRKSILFIVCFLLMTGSGAWAQTRSVAGFRASRLIESELNGQFPDANYWLRVGNGMAQRFTNTDPAGIWIVSIYWNNGVTGVGFPSSGRQVPYVEFSDIDESEDHLTKFDNTGLKIWLQVEPGSADVDTLMDLVMNRYKHHQCVVGFGIDVEWYKYDKTHKDGQKVPDSVAQHWEAHLQSIKSSYTLFLKHFFPDWMPPTYRGNILFVDDSQEFPSLSSMVSEFKVWGSTFSPNKVAFQFGYEADSLWWRNYTDPPSKIGDTLRSVIPNCYGLFWVDFTILKIYPMSSTLETPSRPASECISLSQNYPNPFNPITNIEFRVPSTSQVKLIIYDLLGREVATLMNNREEAGTYSSQWDARGFPSGMYFYQLTSNNYSAVKKMALLK